MQPIKDAVHNHKTAFESWVEAALKELDDKLKEWQAKKEAAAEDGDQLRVLQAEIKEYEKNFKTRGSTEGTNKHG